LKRSVASGSLRGVLSSAVICHRVTISCPSDQRMTAKPLNPKAKHHYRNGFSTKGSVGGSNGNGFTSSRL
jgi:hypothetical protein